MGVRDHAGEGLKDLAEVLEAQLALQGSLQHVMVPYAMGEVSCQAGCAPLHNQALLLQSVPATFFSFCADAHCARSLEMIGGRAVRLGTTA